MASPFQQRALQRKLIYIVTIVVLFTTAYLFRKYVVDKQAESLAIREQSRGEVDWLGSIVRLSTIGSRGVATCVLSIQAMEAKKKNQWNELELYVSSLSKLQPHFITPWIFQSWNLAYNVSVESDRVNDKYYYITRGIQHLAKGERKNQDNPDIRWSIGFFTQHKIGQSDETNTLRSLSQLSMIPPNERDPGRFQVMRDGRQEVNLVEFEDFCKKHPQLVRRLHDGIRRQRNMDQVRQFRCEGAEEVVQFLADNMRVPSKWEDVLPSLAGNWKKTEDTLRPLEDRFPVLPPGLDKRPTKPNQQPAERDALTADSTLLDEHDAFQVSLAWYAYAQEPLPAPTDLPGNSNPIVDRVHQRLPGHMTTLIFRDYPAQAQRFSSERLQDEGWFDETGWDIADYFRDQGDKFADGEPAIVGAGRRWGKDAWDKTFHLWDKFGEDNHLLFRTPEKRDNMEQLAKRFAEHYQLQDSSPVPALREENLDAERRKEFFAWQFMKWWNYYTHISNFNSHHQRALVESWAEFDDKTKTEKTPTILARKYFYEAESLRLRNSASRALRTYQHPDALKAWREKVLLKHKEFRRDSLIQEMSFEIQMKYTDLYTELSGAAFKTAVARMLLMPARNPPGGGVCPVGFAAWLTPLKEDNPLLGGPFDGIDDEGVPLIGTYERQQVLHRLYPWLAPTPPSHAPASGRPEPRR